MAFVVPFLTALGGGSAVTGGVIAASTIASIGTGVMAAQSAKAAGAAQADQYKAEARQEADSARQREVLRRRDLLKALSSQNAAAGAAGVGVVGSVANIGLKDIKYAAEDLLVDRVNSKRGIGILNTAATNAVRSGNLSAAASLLDTAAGVGMTFGGGMPAKAAPKPTAPKGNRMTWGHP
jgi:hypothetical protein